MKDIVQIYELDLNVYEDKNVVLFISIEMKNKIIIN